MGLTLGTVIKTKYGTAKIKQELGAGGQGTVYRVDYNGKEKALKWYHEAYINKLENPKFFYKNLENNIKIGSPSDMFLWPIDISERTNGSFGYIMDLRPLEYKELTLFLLKEKFDSFRVRIDTMLNLVNGFRILHNKGFSYQDLNNGNFFINAKTGAVLACDNDNVAYSGFNTGIAGKMRYMAPEIVLGQKSPDKATDRFSLSVILFMLACKSHPLEGQGATPPCMTSSYEKIIYGEKPVFIFDPNDQSNQPIRGVHSNAIKMWPQWPDYIKKLFVDSFSKECMTYNPSTKTYGMPRHIERDWLEALSRARNELVKCQYCGNEEFINEGCQFKKCSSCGQAFSVLNLLELSKCCIPVSPGAKVYKMQIENCSDDEALMPIAEVISSPSDPHNPYCFGIKNISSEIWRCISSTGMQVHLNVDDIMPVKAGIAVNTAKGTFKIK